MKTLQDHIEEEKEKLEEELLKINAEYPNDGGGWFLRPEEKKKLLFNFFTLSLQRIAKITAEKIVPEKKSPYDFEKHPSVLNQYGQCELAEGYSEALSDLQTKIKEFIK